MRFRFEKLRKEQSLKTPHRLEEIAKAIYEKKGEIPKEGEIRAMALIEGLKIPAAPYSSLEWQRTPKGKEKDIAKYLTNKPGVFIEGETKLLGRKRSVLSFDIRDIYSNGLPKELKEVLDKRSLNYLEKEYEHQKKIIEKYGETKNKFYADFPISYFRLPGGIDLFLRGYGHHEKWQKTHGKFLKEANKYAQVISIEGFPNIPLGKSIDLCWSGPRVQQGDYDVLMREAVENGFNGIFTEVDARGAPFVNFEIVKELPDEFFKNYFGYLKKDFPSLTEDIKSPKNLKKFLVKLSDTPEGIWKKQKAIFHQGKQYYPFPYVDRKGKTSFEPTGFELGRHLFSDALAAIKLHLIAKLMADGYLEKGPIVDYEGAGHLSSKTFFLKYPEYAAEVVLRTIHHLKEGEIKNVPEVYKDFENPNWEEIVKEITKLVFKKPVKTGAQRKLEDVSIDYLKTYGINSKNVIPSDEEVERIIEKLKA